MDRAMAGLPLLHGTHNQILVVVRIADPDKNTLGEAVNSAHFLRLKTLF